MPLNKILVVLVVFLFFANFFIWKEVFSFGKLEVVFFDVGQGDSIFIQTSQGHQVLIDGGPSDAVLEKLGREMPFWDRSLDAVMLTHPDYDHLKGLIYVLEKYEVDNIVWTGVEKETKVYSDWIDGLEGKNVFIAQRGKEIRMGETSLYIFHPFSNLEGERVESSNETSIVSQLVFGENEFVFMGDVYKKQEDDLLIRSDFKSLVCDVLKLAHHGSKNSSSLGFLSVLEPSLAVISVGENSYGHPHQEVLSNLKELGIMVLRTDQKGDIKIIANSNNFLIK